MKHALFSFVALLISLNVHASPGAHGPNGEHLDGATSTGVSSDSTPRFEAFTENFELVGKLYDTELSVLVEEYKTNVPVLKANLELEVSGLKAKATFHDDAGDYAFDDPKILEELKKPGEHELIFTLNTNTESDLVLVTLMTGQAIAAHSHGHGGEGEHAYGDGGHLEEWLHSSMVWAVAALFILIVLLTLVRRRLSGKN